MTTFLRATAALLICGSTRLLAQDGAPALPVTTVPVPSLVAGIYVPGILYYNQVGHPRSGIPGSGLVFNAGGTANSAFERPWFSSDEQHFAINVLAESAVTTDDDILLVDGAVALREGDPTPWPTVGENVGVIDADFAINSSGDLLIGHNSSATANDDYIAARLGGTWVSLAQEGGSMDATCPTLFGGPGGLWDDGMDAPLLLDNGSAMWRAELVDGLSTGLANDEVFVLGGGLVLQEGVDVPLGQAGGGTLAWENFDLNDAFSNGDGSVIAIQGDLAGTVNDDVVVVNGTVVVQEGVVLAGSSFVEPVDVEGIVKAWVDNAGNWYVRGNNDLTETDWVYRNGVVVAFADGTDEIITGTGEHWDDASFADCFFAFDGNASGAYVIGGVTDAAADANGVLVFDDGAGSRLVVVREGDPIDVDGNGLFDDDRFFNTFGNDDVILLEDFTVVFTATVKNAAGTSVDQGVFKYRLPISATCTSYNGTGVNPVAMTCATLPAIGQAWTLAVAPGANTIATLALAGFAPLPGIPLLGGEALVLPPVQDISGGVGLPNNGLLLGIELFVQGVRLDFDGVSLSIVLTNAIDAVIGV